MCACLGHVLWYVSTNLAAMKADCQTAKFNIFQLYGILMLLMATTLSWYKYHHALLLSQSTGRTALFFSAEQGNIEIIKLLLIHGANVDIRDKV